MRADASTALPREARNLAPDRARCRRAAAAADAVVLAAEASAAGGSRREHRRQVVAKHKALQARSAEATRISGLVASTKERLKEVWQRCVDWAAEVSSLQQEQQQR
jgi:hypothetical protein